MSVSKRLQKRQSSLPGNTPPSSLGNAKKESSKDRDIQLRSSGSHRSASVPVPSNDGRGPGSIGNNAANSHASSKRGRSSTGSERRSRSASHGGYPKSSQNIRNQVLVNSGSNGSLARSQVSSCPDRNVAAQSWEMGSANRRFGVKMSGYREDQIVPGFSGFHGREDSFADNVGANARKNARSQVPDSAKYFLASYLKRSNACEGYAGCPSNLTDGAKFDLPGLYCAMGELKGKAAKPPGLNMGKVPFPDVIAQPIVPWRAHEPEVSILAWR